MLRKGSGDPYRVGQYSLAELRAYESRQKTKLFLIGALCIAVGLAALAVFFYRGGF